ncbi:hypothetical protein B0H16DRAFT_1825902 [Mycena metata]|uniref:Helicase C-terminal domain-containing protein n=1 Tax=Mycena metata TaxID=1033252 RepID=A0AAD7NE68_9AGAR|nr:hypothetical protein B0H16DRAFT_1825902 [Mycena metata]
MRSLEDNQEILQLLDNDPICQVVIATVAIANGLNVKSVQDSISISFPETLEQWLQELGWAGRAADVKARGYAFIQPSVLAAAKKQLAATSNPLPTTTKTGKKAPTKALQQAKAEVITEKVCLNAAVNRAFHNPPLDITTLECLAAQKTTPVLALHHPQ